MLLVILSINFVVGLLFGICCRAAIIFPLAGLAVLEGALVGLPQSTWLGAFLLMLGLITSLEYEYLAGVALSVFLPHPVKLFWTSLDKPRVRQ